MEKVKYRAWSKERKTMAYNVEHEYDCGYNNDVFCNDSEPTYCSSFGEMLDSEDWVVMMFTGLLDRHGKEIYEGDIVNLVFSKKGLFGIVKQLEGGAYYIDHQKTNLKYKHQIHCEVCDEGDNDYFFIEYFESYALEVIGNIFEHKDLLK